MPGGEVMTKIFQRAQNKRLVRGLWLRSRGGLQAFMFWRGSLRYCLRLGRMHKFPAMLGGGIMAAILEGPVTQPRRKSIAAMWRSCGWRGAIVRGGWNRKRRWAARRRSKLRLFWWRTNFF